MIPPAGRWAIELQEDGRLVGGAILLPLPPGDEDLEMGWQLHPAAWGRGYATEAGRALARWAFGKGADEVFAVVRPANKRARRPYAGSAWTGSARRGSTTTCGFGCSGCDQQISIRHSHASTDHRTYRDVGSPRQHSATRT
jgi:hypothetical protein